MAQDSEAELGLQRHLSGLVSQQEVELHAAKLASDRAARLQASQKDRLAEAQAQISDLAQEVAVLTR